MPNILTATIWQYFKSSIATRPTDCVASPLINNIAAIASSFILPRRGGDAEGARTILVVCRKRFLATLEMTESHFDACTIVS